MSILFFRAETDSRPARPAFPVSAASGGGLAKSSSSSQLPDNSSGLVGGLSSGSFKVDQNSGASHADGGVSIKSTNLHLLLCSVRSSVPLYNEYLFYFSLGQMCSSLGEILPDPENIRFGQKNRTNWQQQ